MSWKLKRNVSFKKQNRCPLFNKFLYAYIQRKGDISVVYVDLNFYRTCWTRHKFKSKRFNSDLTASRDYYKLTELSVTCNKVSKKCTYINAETKTRNALRSVCVWSSDCVSLRAAFTCSLCTYICIM